MSIGITRIDVEFFRRCSASGFIRIAQTNDLCAKVKQVRNVRTAGPTTCAEDADTDGGLGCCHGVIPYFERFCVKEPNLLRWIDMGKKKQKSEKKTEHQAYGVTVLRSTHSEIRALKKDHEPEIHGDKLWNSSYLIMDYLQHQGMPSPARVLEVGCGWGLLGIYCAKQFGAEVTGVDADPNVFPYLHAQAAANNVTITTRKSRFESLGKGHLQKYDLMLGGDICFWDELIDPVYKLARRAVKAGVDQIIIADPGRPPFDEVCAMAEKKLGGEIIEWEVKSPTKAKGWLLIIGGLPTMTLA